VTETGTGAEYAREACAESRNAVAIAATESGVGTSPPSARSPARRWCSHTNSSRTWTTATSPAGSPAERSSIPLTATSTAAPSSGTMNPAGCSANGVQASSVTHVVSPHSSETSSVVGR
jgi:hypothetical protein